MLEQMPCQRSYIQTSSSLFYEMQEAWRSLCSQISPRGTWKVKYTELLFQQQERITCHLPRRLGTDMVNDTRSLPRYLSIMVSLFSLVTLERPSSWKVSHGLYRVLYIRSFLCSSRRFYFVYFIVHTELSYYQGSFHQIVLCLNMLKYTTQGQTPQV